MKSISTTRLVLILGAMVSVGPLSIDMYLPALPALQAYFKVDEAQVQLTLVAFFIGIAGGQLIYGPLSDRFGRKIPLLVGMAIFSLASLACSMATSIEMLIACRFLQALGGCSGMVISRAIVRDLFEPQEMAKIMSLLVLVMGVCPILAPVLGSFLYQGFGWAAIFSTITGFALLLFFLVANGITETLQKPVLGMTPKSVASNYFLIIKDKEFMRYAMCGGISFSGMFAYIAASAFVFINHFGVSQTQYAWIFGINAAALILGSQLNRYLLARHTFHYMIRRSVPAYALSAILLLAIALSGVGGLWAVMLPLLICMGSLGFIFPNSTAIAMAPFARHAGSASALLGTLQFSCAAVAGSIVGHLPLPGVSAMAAVIAVSGVLAVSILFLGSESNKIVPENEAK